MARKKKRREAGSYELDVNMTPMIDVVFNLIIFFMVITDMTQTDLEFLVLPKAEVAIEDKGEDKDRLIINIVNPRLPDMQGRVDTSRPPIFYRGRQVASLEDLRRRLRKDADPELYPEKTHPEGGDMNPVGILGGRPVYPSRKSLLVRCDQGQIFGWVQAVMQVCTFMPGEDARQQLRTSPLIYKLELAVAEADEDTKR